MTLDLTDVVVADADNGSNMALVKDEESGLYLHPAFLNETRQIMKSLAWWEAHPSPVKMLYDRNATGDLKNSDTISYRVFHEGKCLEILLIGRSWMEEGEQIEFDYWGTRPAYNQTMLYFNAHMSMFEDAYDIFAGIESCALKEEREYLDVRANGGKLVWNPYVLEQIDLLFRLKSENIVKGEFIPPLAFDGKPN